MGCKDVYYIIMYMTNTAEQRSLLNIQKEKFHFMLSGESSSSASENISLGIWHREQLSLMACSLQR